VMDRHDVRRIVFSSSATVYGDPETVPVTEDSPVGRATNPYGWTKVMMEQVMTDLHAADGRWSVALLRYFNPCGAHPSGLIGEDPAGIPNNLMPYIAQVAAGKLDRLPVYGDDYPTVDGTGVRDYVHVVDLAEGHVAALEAMTDPGAFLVYNLGTGRGTSVLELIRAFETATGVTIPYEIVGRRPGDVAETWAAVDKAARDLGWRAKLSIEDMRADMWRWQRSEYAGWLSGDVRVERVRARERRLGEDVSLHRLPHVGGGEVARHRQRLDIECVESERVVVDDAVVPRRARSVVSPIGS